MINHPTPQVAADIVSQITLDKVLSSERLATGDQNFVFAIQTKNGDFVLRMTTPEHRYKFESAIYWQKLLLPLGVPLAQFLVTDMVEQWSPYPSLLMQRLPGTDLCNAYPNLSSTDKMNLAQEIFTIQSKLNILPDALSYGIADSYEQELPDKSWYTFIINRLNLFKTIIKQNGIFDDNFIDKAINIAKKLESTLTSVTARPFLWDASERNVLIHEGKISGIVDVDEICFGDPLFVIGLTHMALALEGHDCLYTDFWEQLLQLDEIASLRLHFYKLFFVMAFMRKHGMKTNNQKQVLFNTQLLIDLFNQQEDCFL